MLLSKRDIRAEIAAGQVGIEPYDDGLVQLSSVDVRLDNLFRVFNNTRYAHIDPSVQTRTHSSDVNHRHLCIIATRPPISVANFAPGRVQFKCNTNRTAHVHC